jgi:manganese/zinc/iron transport system permease protein
MNPYWNTNFFGFFKVLFLRIASFFAGGELTAAPDEIQLGTLAAIAVACGLLGPFLVLKRMTMFANSLSHTILIGIVLAFLCAARLWGGDLFALPTLLIGSFAAALLTAFFTEGLVRFFRLPEDASVGFIFSSLFALGILLVTLFTKNVHLSVEAVMGNVDALQKSDFRLAMWLAVLNLAVILGFYRPLQISAFDRQYATTLGIKASLLHFLLLFLSAAVCVGAFRAVGVLLVLAFLTGPYLTSRLFSHRLAALLFWSPVIGVAASVLGVVSSRHILSEYGLPLSTGGLVVCWIGLFYGLAILYKSIFRDKLLPCENELPS